MKYHFLNSSINSEEISLPDSEKINSFVLKSCQNDVFKAIEFFKSDDILMYIHGFLGTGKRQFINYATDFLDKEVIKLEYYCKESTVSDDILLSFIDIIENNPISKAVNLNAKIMALNIKFLNMLSSIKKPFVIILHSFDDITEENKNLVIDMLQNAAKSENVKIILSTRALQQDILNDVKVNTKIFMKAFSKDIFKEFITSQKIEFTETVLEDFYKYTRGYYYYTALSLKIIQAMKISLSEFLNKYSLSDMSFDSYLGITYINLLPATIRNFFWFLRTIRHGITLNALASLELYDQFSIDYLKSNLMIFQSGETIYVQDYFVQNIDISIPAKTEIKLHKYIVNVYEKQLKEPLKTREIMISRQALRAEIEYHNKCIQELEDGKEEEQENNIPQPTTAPKEEAKPKIPETIDVKIKEAKKFAEEKQNTQAIETYLDVLNSTEIDLQTLVETRIELARLYKTIGELKKSEHYYELAQTYYKQNNEVINLNYLNYELADLYFVSYKHARALETLQSVIYSVDTPQSLMVDACTLMGNIYSEIDNPNEAYSYYKKAIENLEEGTPNSTLAELYFKYALASDEKHDEKIAFEYYNKCISVPCENPFKASAYSNIASCYWENGNDSDAKNCFEKAYEIEQASNNYEGIYYNASFLAKIYLEEKNKKALQFLISAKQCAEFLNENYYILEASIALGDYYYNNPTEEKSALKEYFEAKNCAQIIGDDVNLAKVEARIRDMKLRMPEEDFIEVAKKYDK